MPNLPFLQLLTSTGGGWVIDLLFGLSVLALAIMIERAVIITRQYKYQAGVLPSLTERLEGESPEKLLTSLRAGSVLYRIAKELIDHASKGFASLERHLETRMSLEKRYLEKHVLILGT